MDLIIPTLAFNNCRENFKILWKIILTTQNFGNNYENWKGYL